MKIWQNRGSFLARIENFQSYMRTIARNVATNHFSRLIVERKVLNRLAEEPMHGDPAPGDSVDEQSYMKILEEAIESLPPQQKAVYLMHRRDG